MKRDLKAHILLAEDNKANQRVSKAMLEALGVEVEIAEDGQEVLSLLQQKSFDLILMDCQMPNKDGLEATMEIRQSDNSSYQHIPIIALTADVQSETQEKCKAAGMNDFLSKPFTFDKLLEVLELNLKATD